MPYPFSKAGGGLTSVAWGDITGSISEQGDLSTALSNKLETVAWGDLGGMISSQTDLFDELTDLQAQINALGGGGGPEDVLSNTFWTGGGSGGQALVWSGTQWEASTDEGGSYGDLTRLNSGWIDGLRPTSITLLVNSGEESSWPDRTYSGHQVLVYGTGDVELVAPQSIPWTAWEQDQEIVLTPDFVTYDVDIVSITFLVTNLLSTGPIIKSITFNYD